MAQQGLDLPSGDDGAGREPLEGATHDSGAFRIPTNPDGTAADFRSENDRALRHIRDLGHPEACSLERPKNFVITASEEQPITVILSQYGTSTGLLFKSENAHEPSATCANPMPLISTTLRWILCMIHKAQDHPMGKKTDGKLHKSLR